MFIKNVTSTAVEKTFLMLKCFFIDYAKAGTAQ